MLLTHSSSNTKSAGFTIIELVVVILILGILSVSVGPRFFGVISYENRKAKDELLSALRYSQQLAMNQGGDIEFILTPTNFTVQRSGGGILRSPDGIIPYTKTFPGNITATTISIIHFDALGQPIYISGEPLATDIEFDIGSSKIKVEAVTGYAHEI